MRARRPEPLVELGPATATQCGVADGDWARVSSRAGTIVVPVAHMAALNENTVWTWNAIGKRKGAWGLDPDAPEATTGFLLNHLISELLPDRDGVRLSNSDPVTGQAAWFDQRVRVERVAAADHPRGTAEPGFPELPDPPRAGGGRSQNSSKNFAKSFRKLLGLGEAAR